MIEEDLREGYMPHRLSAHSPRKDAIIKVTLGKNKMADVKRTAVGEFWKQTMSEKSRKGKSERGWRCN